jgi:hypothetical protein
MTGSKLATGRHCPDASKKNAAQQWRHSMKSIQKKIAAPIQEGRHHCRQVL